jgi:hypothetical protein
MAEQGLLGFGLYIALILSTLLTLRQVMWRTRSDPGRRSFYNMAQMIEVSLVGFLVSGAFLSLSYFDLFFHLIAIAVIIKTLAFAPDVAREPASEQSQTKLVHARVPMMRSWPIRPR